MVDKLIEIGIDECNLKSIEEFIKEEKKEEFLKNINLLESLNCNNYDIANIITSNPFFLESDNEMISDLVNYLSKIGFKNLKELFINYPLFLGKDILEVEEYINNKLKEGNIIEDIILEIEDNPIIIDEV